MRRTLAENRFLVRDGLSPRCQSAAMASRPWTRPSLFARLAALLLRSA